MAVNESWINDLYKCCFTSLPTTKIRLSPLYIIWESIFCYDVTKNGFSHLFDEVIIVNVNINFMYIYVTLVDIGTETLLDFDPVACVATH